MKRRVTRRLSRIQAVWHSFNNPIKTNVNLQSIKMMKTRVCVWAKFCYKQSLNITSSSSGALWVNTFRRPWSDATLDAWCLIIDYVICCLLATKASKENIRVDPCAVSSISTLINVWNLLSLDDTVYSSIRHLYQMASKIALYHTC